VSLAGADRHPNCHEGDEEEGRGDAFSCALFDDIHVLHCSYKYPPIKITL